MFHRLLGILTIALLVGFTAVACSGNPATQARYEAEKQFFEAEKASRNAHIRPELVTAEQTSQLMEQYRSTLEFCYRAIDSFPVTTYPRPNADLTDLAFRSAMRLSQLAFAQQQYDTCISVLSRYRDRVNATGIPRISVWLNLGRALQAGGQWDSAQTIYDYCVRTFYPPVDDKGQIIPNLFRLPAHMFEVYKAIGDTVAATKQMHQAEQYYQRLSREYGDEGVGLAAHASLGSLYERTGRWSEAVGELSQLIDSTGQIVNSAKLRIASINATRLDKPDLALRQYDEVLNNLKGRDTLNRPQILFNKALVHLHKGEYSQVRRLISTVKSDYRRFFDDTPSAQFAMARSFELEGRWDRAETEYKFLIENYQGTEESMGAYLYLIHKYKEQGRTREAERMEERAEADYNRIAATRPGTQAEAQALSHKAELYQRRGEWSRSADLLTEVFDKFPNQEVGFRSMVEASVIMRDKLNRPKAADSLLQVLQARLTTIDES
jgi:tetratricopeptide (TPR) repeat protein